jgi:hypothetical protein
MLSTRKEKWASLTTKMITDKIMLETYQTTSKILLKLTMKDHRLLLKKVEERKKMPMHLEMLQASKVQEATSEEVSTINQTETKEETQADLH